MILDTETRNELIGRLRKRGLSKKRASRIVNSFHKAAMKGLQEGKELPFFNQDGFFFRKVNNQIEIYRDIE
ncbi:MAG: hypothetical protein QG620_373 [Patescibacteria group bacterium]|nr:hypothetical protein [Patescibacteria group bacterium]